MCPRCHSDEIRRSKSLRLRDLVMKLWGMKPFRCQQCQKRFYLPSRLAGKIEADREWLQSVQHERHSHRHHRSKDRS